MQLSKIYSKYKTLPNLQLHMLRVSAVAQIVSDNWVGDTIDKKSILQTCLLHDIAKPINFDMSEQRQYVKNENEFKKIEECHKFLVSNFGSEEHLALIKIGKEIGVDRKTLDLLNNLEWHYIKKLMENNDIESLIPIYCDMRISPNGIVTIEKRIEDLKNRTGNNNDQQYEDGEDLQNLMNENTNINLNEITDQQIDQIIDLLRLYVF